MLWHKASYNVICHPWINMYLESRAPRAIFQHITTHLSTLFSTSPYSMRRENFFLNHSVSKRHANDTGHQRFCLQCECSDGKVHYRTTFYQVPNISNAQQHLELREQHLRRSMLRTMGHWCQVIHIGSSWFGEVAHVRTCANRGFWQYPYDSRLNILFRGSTSLDSKSSSWDEQFRWGSLLAVIPSVRTAFISHVDLRLTASVFQNRRSEFRGWMKID